MSNQITDKKQIAKYATAATITTGVAMALPVVSSIYFAPFLVPLVTGMVSDKVAESLGKSSISAVTGILGGLASSAIWEAKGAKKDENQNHDLLKLIANAYAKEVDNLLAELQAKPKLIEKYGSNAKPILQNVKSRIDEALASTNPEDWEALFPNQENLKTQKSEKTAPEKVPFYLRLFELSPKAKFPINEALISKIESEDFILSIAEDYEASKQMLSHEIEVSIKRWNSEKGLEAKSFPKESIKEFLFEHLAVAIPKHIGTLIKEKDFEKSWIAFQRSHLQAILKEVKNNKGLSVEDKELIRPLAEKLDRFSKLEGIPEKLADLSADCFERFEKLEDILNNNQAELLKAIENSERLLLKGIEDLKKQNEELKKQIAEGNLSLEQIKSDLAEQTQMIQMLSDYFDTSGSYEELVSEIKNLSKEYLPNTIPHSVGFVGRVDFLDELIDAYENKNERAFVLWGIGGSGKTATALKLAEIIGDEYFAKVFVDMQGLSENSRSAKETMFEIVKQFEPKVSVDTPTSQLEGLFVQFAQKQPTLIILDNAENESQVAPLIAGIEACFVITSRNDIQLTKGKTKRLVKMSPEDAKELLFSIVEDEEKFEEKAGDLAKLVGYLPIALKPLAKLLKKRFGKISAIIEKYKQKRLELIDLDRDKDWSVEASFELSYSALSDELKEYWRSLAVFPSDFESDAASTVFGTEFDKGFDILSELYDYSLIEEDSTSTNNQPRFILHDLAREFTNNKLSNQIRLNAQLRHSFYYSLILRRIHEIKSKDYINGYANSLMLLDIEWNNITIGQKWAKVFSLKEKTFAELCSSYTEIVPELISLRLEIKEYISWLKSSIKASNKFGLKRLKGINLGNLGSAYKDLGKYKLAIDNHKQALIIAKELNNRNEEGIHYNNLGIAHDNLGNYRQALEYHKKALIIARDFNDRKAEGYRLGNLGTTYNNLGKFEEAIKCHELALTISKEFGDRHAESLDLGGLANAYLSLGNYNEAIKFSKQALAITRQIKDRRGEGKWLGSLGSAYDSLGKYDKAAKYCEQAVEIAKEIGARRDEGISLGNLGIIYFNLGKYDQAIECSKQALKIARIIGDRHNECNWLSNLGTIHSNLGSNEKACLMWEMALSILEDIESPKAIVVRKFLEITNCN